MSGLAEEERSTLKKEQHDEAVRELERLIACYQLATLDDRKVVWAVLNKYAPHIEI